MDGREDLHRNVAGVDTLEFLVDFQDAAQFAIQFTRAQCASDRDRRIAGPHRRSVLRSRRHRRSREWRCRAAQIAVGRISLFEEVVSFGFRNVTGVTRILGCSRHPHASAFTAGRFAHQTQFVRTWNRRRMDLDEFAIGVSRRLPENSG